MIYSLQWQELSACASGSAAFDTIDHEILRHCLHNVFGFGDIVLSWFQSYLEKRIQTVVVYGKH